MRYPSRHLAGNLRWTRAGIVWADWILAAPPYGYRPRKDKKVVRLLHQALFRALPGESLLLGITAGLDPAAVVEQMIGAIDLGRHPDWAAECRATLDTLDQICPGKRIYWLSVPLAQSSMWGRVRSAAASAAAGLQDMAALPSRGPGAGEISARLAQADRVREAIPPAFGPEPASPAQMLWLDLHMQQRGLYLDLDVPGADVPGADEGMPDLMMPASRRGLPEPLLDEGGQSDLSRTELKRWFPATRKYLKVAQAHRPGDTPASYQSLLVLTDVPQGGMRFPGSEFIGRIDESGLDVDWAMRLTQRSSDQVNAENRRALTNLSEQYHQREGEVSFGLNTLDRAAAALSEYAAVLDSDKNEVEVEATVIFCVSAGAAEDASRQARALAGYLADADYKVAQPIGYQEELWWAMHPGVPASKAVREFEQITTSRALAAAVPLASSELGDGEASLLAVNISTGRPGTVLHNAAGASGRDVSGSLALAGELGSGKSAALKKLSGDVIDQGGRVIAVDRTPVGEYAKWAGAVTAAVVVDTVHPEWSLDPLRLFPRSSAGRVAQSFLTPLLNIAPTSDRGILLGEVLEPDYLDTWSIRSLGELLEHLGGGCALDGARELAKVMRVFARRDFGRVIFDGSLRPLSLAARCVIIRTHEVQLPSREDLEHKHLFDQMPLERIYGRAFYSLITSISREICFSDPTELGVYVVDETHHITASPEGERELIEFVRDGRKHRAAVFMGSHDPEADFGSPTLRGLVPTRILMRHRDDTLARRGLKWLGLDETDEDLVEMLKKDTSPVTAKGVEEHRRGEAFIRDSSGNIGRGKILLPSVAARNQACRTSPPEKTDLAPAGA